MYSLLIFKQGKGGWVQGIIKECFRVLLGLFLLSRFLEFLPNGEF